MYICTPSSKGLLAIPYCPFSMGVLLLPGLYLTSLTPSPKL